MDKHDHLPFKVGQLAEAQSFQQGYRGAWFRCKIRDVSWKKGRVGYVLEYFDFPDEKLKWTKLFQLPLIQCKTSKERERQLMVRPYYPPIYHENQVPNLSKISEAVVVFNGVCKVGDLVDWWTDGCYWSGRVIQILDEDKVKVELPPPPVGEGESYEISCKDLRPSLDWSLENGWMVPTSMDSSECLPCARIILPSKQAHVDKSKDSLPVEMLTPLCLAVPEEIHQPQCSTESGSREKNAAEISCSNAALGSFIGDESSRQFAQENLNGSSGSLKFKSEGILSNSASMCSDPLEAAILDLEELSNKVKWLKEILEFGVPLSGALRPSWNFVESCAESSTPK